MTTDEHMTLERVKAEWPISLKHYMIGFFSSLLLTIVSFAVAIYKLFSINALIFTLVSLAVIQAFIQLIFFMHLGQDAKPKWLTLLFWFMILVVLIVVLLSLWIMFDLDKRMMF
jgi:cytochrome o ubiquinol oxidase operon protein cyoD